MVDTIKFSEMADGGDIQNNDKVPGLEGGQNVLFNNPWTFLPSGTTAQRPTPSVSVNYRLRLNTDDQVYEYYNAVLGAWVQIDSSAFTAGPFLTYTADAGLPDAQNLGALSDGLLKQTIALGSATLDIALNGIDYWAPGDALTRTQAPVVGDDVTNKTYVDAQISGAVTSVEGTEFQVLVNATFGTPETGAIVLTTPQDIAPTSSPEFVDLTLSNGSIFDTNANIVLQLTPVASAVNYIEISNNSTGNSPLISSSGTDTNIDLTLSTQGVGVFDFQSAALTNQFLFKTGTALVHETIFNFPATSATRTATWQDASGTVAYLSDIPSVTPSALTKTDDTNVTLTLGGSPTVALLAATSLTLGWAGQLGLTRGGTNASLTASNGGLVYSTATELAILAAGSAGQIPRSGGAGAPSWSTATYPATAGTQYNALASDGTNFTSQTLTSLLDGAFGNTQGNILYRNATVWTVLAPGANGEFLQSLGPAANVQWAVAAGTGFTSVNVQVFTSSGTYTPTSGMAYCIIECIGGGGGGGGVTGAGANFQWSGGGGGSGSYARKFASAATVGASQTVTIGAAGAAGANTGGTGGTGGDTSVGAICIGKGGSGGVGNTTTSVVAGGAGGVAGTGDFTPVGNGGGPGNGGSPVYIGVTAGQGAPSVFGGAPAGTGTGSGAIAGANGSNYGAGGNGGVSAQTSTAAIGGTGSAGIVVITEYIA